ncbi:MAG: hypothetical protein ACI9BW_002627 [Gammaproteobacteria bacterium]|jgi:hypothetical protein
MTYRSKPIETLLSVAFAMVLLLCSTAQAEHHEAPSISSLSWMTGHWAGPAGPGLTLEENWIEPVDGSIASVVRITGNGKTSMVELIIVEEESNSLVLRLQQWDAGFKPRTPMPQTMNLVGQTENSVSFAAAGEGGLKKLKYSRPEVGQFHIDVEDADGNSFTLKLSAPEM